MSPDDTNGGAACRVSTLSPKGRHRTTAVRKPAAPVVRIRTHDPVRASQARSRSSQPASRATIEAPAQGVDRPQGAPDGDHRHQRDEDAQLRLDDRGDDGQDRRAFGVVAPQLTQGQEQEQDAERVDLSPHDAVEPEDRVDDDDDRGQQGSRSRPPSSRTIDQASQAIPRSARIGGILMRSPTPPTALATAPTSHRTYRYPGV